MQIAQRVQQITPSATLAVSAKAAAMRREGIDVVSYGAGEPDFDTPDAIKQVAKQAIDAGKTKYAQPATGIPEARAAVCEKFRRDNSLSYAPEQVLITCGGKEATGLMLAATVNPGDEVLLPAPYWVSFPEQIRLCGATPVLLRGDERNEFKLTPAQLAAALTPRTRALIFNSPSNPGGFTYTRDEMRGLAAAMSGRDLLVLADEMYDRLTYDGPAASFAGLSDEWYAKTVTVNAASKSYAMTGWRLGYAAGPEPVIRAMAALQSHTTTGPCTFNQVALAHALRNDQSCVEQMRSEFQRRALHMHERIGRLRDVRCVRPTGAFYCFPNVSRCYARLGVGGSVAFAEKVLTEAHVALVPGAAFGCDENVRLSFACSMAEIDKGLDRLERLLGRA